MSMTALAEQQSAFPAPANELPDFASWPVTTDGVPEAELLLEEPTTAQAGEQCAEEAHPEEVPIAATASSYEPPKSISDRLRGLWVGMQVRQIARNWNLEKRWHDMSRRQHMIARLATGTTVMLAGITALVVGRTSGAAAHGLEESGMLQFPELPTVPTYHASYLENVGTQMTLVADKTLDLVSNNDYDDQIDLKLDPNAHPEPVPLGKWNEETGHGTIWNQVMAYADEMGYGELTPRQERALVQETLDHNHRTWTQARDLSTTYEPELLTRNEMQVVLDSTGAKQTHVADLPVADIPPPRGPDTTRDLPPVPGSDPPHDTDTQAQPGARTGVDPYSEVPKFPLVDWFPADNLDPKDPDWVVDNWLIRTRVDDELGELLIGAGIVGAAAYGVHQRSRRRRAERRLAAIEGRRVVVDDEDDEDVVVVDEPPRRVVTEERRAI